MDWAASEWKQNLPALAIQKINALEEQVERFHKERQQKQFQIESLEQNVNIQKRKYEDEKSEKLQLQKEQQCLEEKCVDFQQKLQRLHQELQTKDVKLDCLEGQLAQSKKLIEKENAKLKQQEETMHSVSEKGKIICDLESDSKKPDVDVPLNKDKAEMPMWEKIGTPQNYSKRGQVRPLDELEKSRIDNDLAAERIKILEQKLKQMNQELECQRHNSEAVKLAMEQKFKEKENSYKEDIKNNVQALSDLNKEFNETKTKLQQELSHAQKSLDANRFQLDKIEHQKLEQETEMHKLYNRIQELESSCQTKEKAITDQKKSIQSLEKEKSFVTNKLNEQESKHTELLNKFKKVECQLEQKEKELCQTEQSFDEQSTQLHETQNKLGLLTEQHDTVVREFKLKLSGLEKQIKEFKSLVAIKEKLIIDLQNDMKTSSHNIKDFEAKLNQNEHISRGKDDEIIKLKQKVDMLSQELTANKNKSLLLEQELNDERKQLSINRNNLAALTKDVNQKQELIKNYDETITLKENMLSEAKAKLDKTLNNIEEKNNKIKESEDMLITEIGKLKKLEESSKTLSLQYKEKVNEVNQLETNLQKKIEQIFTFEEKLKLLEKEKIENEETLKHMKEKLNIKELELLDYENTKEKLSHATEQLHATVKDMKQKKAELKIYHENLTEIQSNAQQLTKSVEEKEDRIQSLQILLKEKEQYIKEIEIKNKNAIIELESMNECLQKMQFDINERKVEFEQQQQKLQEICQHEQLNEQKNKELETCIKIKEDQIYEYETKARLSSKELESYCESIDSLNKEIITLKEEMNNICKHSEEQLLKVKYLEELISTKEVDIIKYKETCDNSKETVKEQEQEIALLQSKLEDTMDRLQIEITQTKELKLSMEQMKENSVNINELKQEHEKIKILEENETKQEEKIHDLQNEISKLELCCSELKDVITQKESQVDQFRREANIISEISEQQFVKIKVMEGIINTKEEEINMLNKQKEFIEAELTKYKEICYNSKEKIKTQQIEIDKLRSEFDNTIKQLHSKTSQLEELESSLEQLKQNFISYEEFVKLHEKYQISEQNEIKNTEIIHNLQTEVENLKKNQPQVVIEENSFVLYPQITKVSALDESQSLSNVTEELDILSKEIKAKDDLINILENNIKEREVEYQKLEEKLRIFNYEMREKQLTVSTDGLSNSLELSKSEVNIQLEINIDNELSANTQDNSVDGILNDKDQRIEELLVKLKECEYSIRTKDNKIIELKKLLENNSNISLEEKSKFELDNLKLSSLLEQSNENETMENYSDMKHNIQLITDKLNVTEEILQKTKTALKEKCQLISDFEGMLNIPEHKNDKNQTSECSILKQSGSKKEVTTENIQKCDSEKMKNLLEMKLNIKLLMLSHELEQKLLLLLQLENILKNKNLNADEITYSLNNLTYQLSNLKDNLELCCEQKRKIAEAYNFISESEKQEVSYHHNFMNRNDDSCVSNWEELLSKQEYKINVLKNELSQGHKVKQSLLRLFETLTEKLEDSIFTYHRIDTMIGKSLKFDASTMDDVVNDLWKNLKGNSVDEEMYNKICTFIAKMQAKEEKIIQIEDALSGATWLLTLNECSLSEKKDDLERLQKSVKEYNDEYLHLHNLLKKEKETVQDLKEKLKEQILINEKYVNERNLLIKKLDLLPTEDFETVTKYFFEQIDVLTKNNLEKQSKIKNLEEKLSSTMWSAEIKDTRLNELKDDIVKLENNLQEYKNKNSGLQKSEMLYENNTPRQTAVDFNDQEHQLRKSKEEVNLLNEKLSEQNKKIMQLEEALSNATWQLTMNQCILIEQKEDIIRLEKYHEEQNSKCKQCLPIVEEKENDIKKLKQNKDNSRNEKNIKIYEDVSKVPNSNSVIYDDDKFGFHVSADDSLSYAQWCLIMKECTNIELKDNIFHLQETVDELKCKSNNLCSQLDEKNKIIEELISKISAVQNKNKSVSEESLEGSKMESQIEKYLHLTSVRKNQELLKPDEIDNLHLLENIQEESENKALELQFMQEEEQKNIDQLTQNKVATLNNLEERIMERNACLLSIKQCISSNTTKVQKLVNELNNVEQHIQDKVSALSILDDEIKEKNNNFKHIQQSLSDSDAEFMKLTNQLKHIQQVIQDKNTVLHTLEEETIKSNAKLTNVKQLLTYNSVELQKLLKQLSENKEIVQEKDATSHNLDKEILESNVKLQNIYQSLSSNSSELEKLLRQLKEIEQLIQDKTTVWQRLEVEITGKNAKLTNIEELLSLHSIELQKLLNRLKENEETTQEKNVILHNLDKEISESNVKLQNIQQTLFSNSAELEKSCKQLKDIDHLIQEKRITLRNLEEKIIKNSSSFGKMEEICELLQQKDDTIDKLNSAIQKHVMKIEELNLNIEVKHSLEEETKQLNLKIKELSLGKKLIQEENLKLNQNCACLNEKLNDDNIMIEKLKNEIELLELQYAEKCSIIESLKNEFSKILELTEQVSCLETTVLQNSEEGLSENLITDTDLINHEIFGHNLESFGIKNIINAVMNSRRKIKHIDNLIQKIVNNYQNKSKNDNELIKIFEEEKIQYTRDLTELQAQLNNITDERDYNLNQILKLKEEAEKLHILNNEIYSEEEICDINISDDQHEYFIRSKINNAIESISQLREENVQLKFLTEQQKSTITQLNETIEEIEENLQKVFEEKSTMSEDIVKLQDQCDHLLKEQSELKYQLNEQNNQLKNMNEIKNENVCLRVTQEQLEMQLKMLQDELIDLVDKQEKAFDLETKLIEVELKLDDTEQELKYVTEKYNDEVNKKKQLETEISDLKSDHENIRKQLCEINIRNEELESENQHNITELEVKIQELRKKELKIQESDAILLKLRTEISGKEINYIRELNECNVKINEQNSNIKKLEADLQSVQQQHSALLKEQQENEIELENTWKKFKSADEALAKKENEITVCNKKLKIVTAEYEWNKETLKENKNSLENQLLLVKNEACELNTQLQSVNKELCELKCQLQEKNAELTSYKSKLEESAHQVKATQLLLADSKSVIEEYENNIALTEVKLKTQLKATEDNNKYIEQLNKTIQCQTDKLEEERQKYKEFADKCEALNIRIRQIESEKTKLNDKCSTLQTVCNEKDERIEILQNETNKTVKTLAENGRKHVEELEMLENSYKLMQTELESKIKCHQNEIQILEEKRQQIITKTGLLEQQCKSLKAYSQKLEEELSVLKSKDCDTEKIQDLKDQLKSNAKELQEKETELASVWLKYTQTLSKVDKLTEKCEWLKEKFEESEKQLKKEKEKNTHCYESDTEENTKRNSKQEGTEKQSTPSLSLLQNKQETVIRRTSSQLKLRSERTSEKTRSLDKNGKKIDQSDSVSNPKPGANLKRLALQPLAEKRICSETRGNVSESLASIHVNVAAKGKNSPVSKIKTKENLSPSNVREHDDDKSSQEDHATGKTHLITRQMSRNSKQYLAQSTRKNFFPPKSTKANVPATCSSKSTSTNNNSSTSKKPSSSKETNSEECKIQ